jgi:hypothetical protein
MTTGSFHADSDPAAVQTAGMYVDPEIAACLVACYSVSAACDQIVCSELARTLDLHKDKVHMASPACKAQIQLQLSATEDHGPDSGFEGMKLFLLVTCSYSS